MDRLTPQGRLQPVGDVPGTSRLTSMVTLPTDS
jgi:hypothetical protein